MVSITICTRDDDIKQRMSVRAAELARSVRMRTP